MIIRFCFQKFIMKNILAILFLIQSHSCYRLSPLEQTIISAITSLTDLRHDFSRHFLEAVSLPVLAPILVRNGALLGMSDKISPTIVQNELKNAGIGTFLHGLSLLPITLPVSVVHMLSAPVAIPYRRRVGRALENQLRKDITVVMKQLHQLADITEKTSYNLNYINIVPQNTLEHSTLEYHDPIPPLPPLSLFSSLTSLPSGPPGPHGPAA